MTKTNVVRLLVAVDIKFNIYEYDTADSDISAVVIVHKMGRIRIACSKRLSPKGRLAD